MDLEQRLYELENRTGLSDISDVFQLIDDLFAFAHDAVSQNAATKKQLSETQCQLTNALKKLSQDQSIISILEDTNL